MSEIFNEPAGWRQTAIRYGAGTLLVSSVATGFASIIPGQQVLEWRFGESEPTITTEYIEGGPVERPAILRAESVPGPGLELRNLLPYARDFNASELTGRQRQVLREYIDSLIAPDVVSAQLRITGWASDEDLTTRTSNLGVDSEKNITLSLQRAELVEDDVTEHVQANDLPISILSVTGREGVLASEEIAAIKSVAVSRKLTLDELLQAYNSGQDLGLNSDEAGIMKSHFDDNRSVVVESVIERRHVTPTGSCDEVVTIENVPGRYVNTPTPGDNGFGINFVPIPMLPLRRIFRKRQVQKSSPTGPSHETVQNVAEPARSRSPRDEQYYKYMRARRAEHQAQIKLLRGDITRADYTAIARRASRLERAYTRGTPHRRFLGGLGVLAAFVAFPVPGLSEEQATNQVPPEQCATYSIDQGSKRETFVTFLGEYALSYIQDRPPQRVVFDRIVIPTVITETKLPHKKFVVDGNGKLLETIDVPEQIGLTQLVSPRFKEDE